MSETIVVTNDIKGKNRTGFNLEILLLLRVFKRTVHSGIILAVSLAVKKLMNISINK